MDEDEEVRRVGLWIPGLVFCWRGPGRRAILLAEEEVGFRRDAVDAEEELDFGDLGEGLLPLVEGLTAITTYAERCNS